MSPPDNWRVPRGHHSPGTPPPNPRRHHSTRSLQGTGRRADEFREDFRRGAIDALRLLGRRCCLDCAVEVERLADQYAEPTAAVADRRT